LRLGFSSSLPSTRSNFRRSHEPAALTPPACRRLGMPPGFAVVRVLADCSTIIAARRDGSRVDAAVSRSVGQYGERRGAADRNRSAPPPGRVARSPPKSVASTLGRMPIVVLTMNATASASVSRTVLDAGRSSARWWSSSCAYVLKNISALMYGQRLCALPPGNRPLTASASLIRRT